MENLKKRSYKELSEHIKHNLYKMDMGYGCYIYMLGQINALQLLHEDECSKIRANLFDQEEIHTNCTVQLWKNSKTGDVSFGWWENE